MESAMSNEKENCGERTDLKHIERYVPIDKGWAWVILIATFSIAAINIGTEKASGLFFIEFLDTFQGNVSKTALVASLMDIVSCIVTILVLIVALKKLSVRACVCIGLILCAVGYGISSVSTSLELLIIIQSSFIGIGSAFYLTPLLVIIEEYFDKRKGLANALFTSGFSLGGLVMPLLYRYILDTYGLRGGLVLTSGFTLNSIVFGALLRPITFYTRGCNKKYDTTVVIDHEEEDKPSDSLIKVNTKLSPSDVKNENNKISCSNTFTAANGQLCRERANTFSTDTTHLPDKGVQDKKVKNPLLEKVSDSFAVRYLSTSELAAPSSALQLQETRSSKSVVGGLPAETMVNEEIAVSSKHNTDCQQRDKLFLSQPFLNINNEQHITRERSNTFSTHPSNRKGKLQNDHSNERNKISSSFAIRYLSSVELCTASSALELNTVPETKDDTENLSPVPTKWWRSIDLSLFKNLHFILVLACLSFGSIAIRTAHIYIPIHAKDMTIEDQKIAVIVSVVNICDFLGRITAGLIADRAWTSPTRIALVSQLTVGIVLQFMKYYKTFWHLVLFAVVYGSTAGVIIALFPTMLLQTVGKEQFRQAMAVFILVLGLEFGLTLPFLGYLRDVTGTYYPGFLYISSCCFTTSVLLGINDFISRRKAA